METLIFFLPVLACGALMFFCMRHMTMGSKHDADQGIEQSSSEEIAELREDIARLRAEKALTSESFDQEPLSR